MSSAKNLRTRHKLLLEKKNRLLCIFAVLFLICAGGFFALTQTSLFDHIENTEQTESAPIASNTPSSESTTEVATPHTADKTKANPTVQIEETIQLPETTLDTKPKDRLKMHPREILAGDTAGAILQEWLSASEVHSLITSCNDVYPLAKIRVGQPYTVYEDASGFSKLEYEVDAEKRLTVLREKDGYKAELKAIDYDIRLAVVEGSINSNLFSTMEDLKEEPVLAILLADIFAWEIDFIRDIQPNDSFRVLVEKRWRDGSFHSYGKIKAAIFINQSINFEAYAFADSLGNRQYYNSKGESIKKAFLKAPLSFTRISSKFSNARKHPILNVVRPHPGIDYAAPSGTPVMAIGNGQVTVRAWENGAGNYITLRHMNGYESMYLHLKGFASGLAKGKKVQQGEVIGYVGSTGYSTGPHLDFRIKKDGTYLNPSTLTTPRAEPVSAASMSTFIAEKDTCLQYMTGHKSLTEYAENEEEPTTSTIN